MDSNPSPAVTDPPNGAKKRRLLSPRRLQVLALVAEGASDGEIALALGISSTTVAWYVQEIRSRLGARSRAHAVALAMRQGLLPVGSVPEHSP